MKLSFPINIDVALACSVYDRSLKALNVIAEIDNLMDSDALGFREKKKILKEKIPKEKMPERIAKTKAKVERA